MKADTIQNINPFQTNGIFHKAIYTIKPGWSIVYVLRSHRIQFPKKSFLSLKIDFIIANSADPDECCIMRLPKYQLRNFSKGLKYSILE